MKLIVTAEAENDLRMLGRWIARDNPRRAVTFVRDLRRLCLSLTDFPEKYPLLARHSASAIRRMVHGSYLIFYRIDGTSVVIIHVLHGASDYDAILFPNED